MAQKEIHSFISKLIYIKNIGNINTVYTQELQDKGHLISVFQSFLSYVTKYKVYYGF